MINKPFNTDQDKKLKVKEEVLQLVKHRVYRIDALSSRGHVGC